jgi:long-chain acyl-CoA synthetase
MKKENIVRTIRSETGSYQEKIAAIEGDRSITYARLFDRLDLFADELKSKGLGPSDRVAFLCDDSIDYIIVSLAVLSIDAVVVPVSPSLTGEEIVHVLERIDVHVFVFDDSLFDDKKAESLTSPFESGRRFRLARRTPKGDLPREYFGMNAAFIRFSSGTTGMSKGVLLSHESILERTSAADAGLCMTADDVVLWILSMSYHFVVSILLFLRRATTIVICRSDSLLAFREGVTRYRGTFIYASPFYYHMITASREITPDALSGVRMAISTATNLPRGIADAFRERFGKGLSGAYGIIEVGLPCIDSAGDDRKPGSVGKILPAYEIRIEKADAQGIGEIFVRGEGMFDAYFSPWRLREEALEEGWFRTGDMGCVDEEGTVFIVGREKNVIIFSGMKVFPYEVEAVINQYPAVGESLVYGVDHPVFGQLPAAKIVLGETGEGDGFLEGLRRFCYERLASYKVPKAFEVVPALEKTASDKLVR